jgi:uncharacterized protein
MGITFTYPGVYIQEKSSGVHTIIGVATSITAFVGRAARGPTDKAISISSFADFERIFGGLWTGSNLGYAVRDFYLNGGSQAIIVRLFNAGTAGGTGESHITVGGLELKAASPGTWGDRLTAEVDHNVLGDAAISLGLAKDDLFNLKVTLKLTLDASDPRTEAVEYFRNLSVKDSLRRVDRVLEQSSRLVRVVTRPAGVPPDKSESTVSTAGLPGDELTAANFVSDAHVEAKTGLYALEDADLFNLLCIPPYKAGTEGDDVEEPVLTAAIKYCEDRRAFLIIDPPTIWVDKDAAKAGVANDIAEVNRNAAVFFPRVLEFDLLRDNRLETFAPCGAVAGVFARTDTQRGVWKAPAGLDAALVGVSAPSVLLTEGEIGELNPLGVNCLRVMPGAGPVVWGARTREGNDRLASEWKYIPVRRTALFIEESLYRGTQWVVFEPNDEPLWAQIRLNVGAFMHSLFRQGAFQGKSTQEAYFVKCDNQTTTQDDINRGIVNILVGFAPLKPAEFVIIKLQQMAGQIQT